MWVSSTLPGFTGTKLCKPVLIVLTSAAQLAARTDRADRPTEIQGAPSPLFGHVLWQELWMPEPVGCGGQGSKHPH